MLLDFFRGRPHRQVDGLEELEREIGLQRRGSIRTRIFLGMIGGVFSFLALTLVVMDRLIERVLDAEVASSLERARQVYHGSAQLRSQLLLDNAQTLSLSPDLRAILRKPAVDPDFLAATIRELAESSDAQLILVANAKGEVLSDSTGPPMPVSELNLRPGVDLLLSGSEFSGTWQHRGSVFFVAAQPVLAGNRVLGFVALGQRVDGRVAIELQRMSGHDVTLLQGGRVLTRAWNLDRLGVTPGRTSRVAGTVTDWVGVSSDRSVVDVHGRKYLATAIPIGSSGTTLILSRPVSSELEYFHVAKKSILLIALAIAILALFVSQRISDRIGRPIQALRDSADALARGENFERVDVDTHDEVGALAQSFNDMAQKIQRLLGDVTRKAQAAQQANEAKSAFLATVSHELRTPLNGVLGFAEQLLEGSLNGEQRAQVQVVQRAGEDLLAIIEDILDFSKIEAGEMRLENVPFSMSKAMSRAVDPLRAEAKRKGLSLELEIDSNVPEHVIGPMGRLRQVVINFVGNAVKFTSEGSVKVHVGLVLASRTHATVQVVVKDTGIGISEEGMERLFKPFSQVEFSYDRRFGGTGLGLAISKELIDMMGGLCGVNSKPGQGSSFWFTTRLKQQKGFDKTHREDQVVTMRERLASRSPTSIMPALPAFAGSSQSSLTRGRCVLVVEDNKINQKMAEMVLRKGGWQYELAEDGREALEMCALRDYDIVLMDCQMPGMNGLEATKRLREIESSGHQHTPIIALTANAFDQDREICLQAGMDDFLSKPFKANELLEMLAKWVSKSDAVKRA